MKSELQLNIVRTKSEKIFNESPNEKGSTWKVYQKALKLSLIEESQLHPDFPNQIKPITKKNSNLIPNHSQKSVNISSIQ